MKQLKPKKMTDKEKIKDLENKIEQLRRTIEGYRLLVDTKDETLNIYKQLNALK